MHSADKDKVRNTLLEFVEHLFDMFDVLSRSTASLTFHSRAHEHSNRTEKNALERVPCCLERLEERARCMLECVKQLADTKIIISRHTIVAKSLTPRRTAVCILGSCLLLTCAVYACVQSWISRILCSSASSIFDEDDRSHSNKNMTHSLPYVIPANYNIFVIKFSFMRVRCVCVCTIRCHRHTIEWSWQFLWSMYGCCATHTRAHLHTIPNFGSAHTFASEQPRLRTFR